MSTTAAEPFAGGGVRPSRAGAGRRAARRAISVSSARGRQDRRTGGLSALWIAMLIVFAYVDIFGFLRADTLDAARDGKVAATGVAEGEIFGVGPSGAGKTTTIRRRIRR